MDLEKKIEAPAGIVRHRQAGGTIRHGDRIDRFWRNKVTGTTVQVVSYYIDVDQQERWVNYLDPDIGRNLSMKRTEFEEKFTSCGNKSDKF